MTLLEQVRAWIETYQGMERLSDFWIDDMNTGGNNGGIFPRGVSELERKEDILGNVEVLNQHQFKLYYVFTKEPGNNEGMRSNAEWLMAFQDWVQEQSIQDLAPPLGLPGRSARAEKGMLYRNGEDGSAAYTVVLTIKYKKRYEV